MPRDVEPQQALLEELHRTANHVAWLPAKIASFDTADELKHHDATDRFERPSVWLELYQAERAHLLRVAKACMDAGVAEREVRLAEEQGRQFASVVRPRHSAPPAHPAGQLMPGRASRSGGTSTRFPDPAPWLLPEDLEEQRAELTESQYARLHLNQWCKPEDRLTTVDDVRACVTLDGLKSRKAVEATPSGSTWD